MTSAPKGLHIKGNVPTSANVNEPISQHSEDSKMNGGRDRWNFLTPHEGEVALEESIGCEGALDIAKEILLEFE